MKWKLFLTNKLNGCAKISHQPRLFVEFSLGRSMIEMLGVLAIIGILSIGGLYVYRQAMDKYKTNAVLNEIQQIISVVQNTCSEKMKQCTLISPPQGFNPTHAICSSIPSCIKDGVRAKTASTGQQWYIYHNAQETGSFPVYRIFMGGFSEKMCKNIVSAPWTNDLFQLHVRTSTGAYAENTYPFNDVQKNKLLKACENRDVGGNMILSFQMK